MLYVRRDVYVARETNESPNDRNDRAIRECCLYYSRHLDSNQIKIVLLSDDQANITIARSKGILAYKCREYVSSLKNKPELIDRLAAKEKPEGAEISEEQVTDSTRKNKHIIFPEHLKLSEIQTGIKTKRFFQGSFQSSRDNYLEANVFLNDNEKYPSIFIQGLKNLNRAVHDDTVAVELLPESEWATPTSLVLEEGLEDTGDYINPQEEDEQVAKNNANRLPTGRVVGIIKRNWRQYCGMLQVSDLTDATRHLFIPAEKRIPKIRIETRQAQALKSQRIVVAIDCWPRDSRYPMG